MDFERDTFTAVMEARAKAPLMEEPTGTENTVGFARQFYNDIATTYNTAQQVFWR